MVDPDPRITPVREDLPRLPEGKVYQVNCFTADLRQTPEDTAQRKPRESQLFYGELFTVYDEQDGWCWGQSQTDNYVGYIRREKLSYDIHKPTHILISHRATIYPEPDTKSLMVGRLSFLSRLRLLGEENEMAELSRGGWVRKNQTAPVGDIEPDFTATAEHFLGVPYLWAGRSGDALDCSALVQLCLARAGIEAPRDSDLQRQSLGHPVFDRELKRGDLVYFKGHTGIMIDKDNLLHADPVKMYVTIDPLEKISARCNGVLEVRRI